MDRTCRTNTASWARLERLFHAALQYPDAQRAAFVQRACRGNSRLRAAVTRLLAAHARAGTFIETPAAASLRAQPHGAPEPGEPGAVGLRYGPYVVTREIARGGMGAVYLAERADGHFARRVAIKLVKRGMDTDAILERFRAERRILASLDHPNIARLLDGGTSDDGRPYFVMEYIAGEPIDRFADARRLSVPDRLRLFLQVCAGVSHAHHHHVIHRDLKPSNILVTSDGVPKLLDFGIAKALAPDGGETTSSIAGVRLLTLEYASPEQVAERSATPASDVYSLGVVLYELLTGLSPYRVPSRGPLEIARAVQTATPGRPSAALKRDDITLARAFRRHVLENESAAARASSARGLRRALRGDLDTIILKALRKEPAQRYQSAEAFAADIRRHLDGRPVLARPEGIAYRAGKLLRRNRSAAISSSVAATAALAIALASTAIRTYAPEAAPAAVLAPRDRILVSDFANHGTDPTLGAAVTEAVRVDLAQSPYVQLLSPRQLRSGLARMARAPTVALDDSLARELAVREGVKAFVTGSVGMIGGRYILGAQLMGAEKGELLTAVRETASDSNDVIQAVGRLSAALRRHMGESLRSVRATPSLARVATPSLDALRLYTRGRRLERAQQRDRAAMLLERAVRIDTGFASAYRMLGNVYGDGGEHGRAMVAFEHALANQQRLPYYERYQTLASYAYNYLHDYPRAIAAFRHLLDRYPNDVVALNNLGYVYAHQRRWAAQQDVLRRAIAADSSIASIHLTLAMSYVNDGRYDRARRQIGWVKAHASGVHGLRLAEIYEPASRQDWITAERMARVRIAAEPNDSSDAMDGYETLAGLVMAQGRIAEGEGYSRRVTALATALHSPARLITSAIRVANIRLRYYHDPRGAMRELDAALRYVRVGSVPEGDRHYDDFARIAARAGDVARARQLVRLGERLRLDRASRIHPDRHWSLGVIALAEHRAGDAVAELRAADSTSDCTICVLPDLARAYDAAGEPDSAVAVYERYLTLPWQWRFETDDLELGAALERLGELYEQRGDRARSRVMYERLLHLWRHADPVLRPMRAEVRRRLARRPSAPVARPRQKDGAVAAARHRASRVTASRASSSAPARSAREVL